MCRLIIALRISPSLSASHILHASMPQRFLVHRDQTGRCNQNFSERSHFTVVRPLPSNGCTCLRTTGKIPIVTVIQRDSAAGPMQYLTVGGSF